MSLFNFFSRKQKKAEPERSPDTMAFDYGVKDKVGDFRYPPFLDGLPITDVADIVAAQSVLIQKIRISLGLSKAEFNRLVMPLIVNYAGHVHLLPASEDHHHKGSAGLFRHGLEVAFWATQASDAILFTVDGTPNEIRDKEPRWKLAACIAGLLHDAAKPMTDVTITSDKADKPWNSQTETIVEWANRYGVTDYHIHWRRARHQKHEKFALAAAKQLITNDIFNYIQEADPKLIETLFDAITRNNITQPLTQIAQKADEQSVVQDLKENNKQDTNFEYSVPVEIFVTDALRVLINSKRWSVNEPGSKVWYCKDGAFVVWRGIDDLYKILERDDRKGVPKDPDMLADILIDRNFAIENNCSYQGQEGVFRYWEITPHILSEAMGGKPVTLSALRIADPFMIFTAGIPEPVEADISGAETVNYAFSELDDDEVSESLGDESQAAECNNNQTEPLSEGDAQVLPADIEPDEDKPPKSESTRKETQAERAEEVAFPFDLPEIEPSVSEVDNSVEKVSPSSPKPISDKDVEKPVAKEVQPEENPIKASGSKSTDTKITSSVNKPSAVTTVTNEKKGALNKTPKFSGQAKTQFKKSAQSENPAQISLKKFDGLLAKRSKSRALLEKLLSRYQIRNPKKHSTLTFVGLHVAFKYPQEFKAFGDPKALIAQLMEEDAIVGVDGIKARAIHVRGEDSYVLLNKSLSRCLSSIATKKVLVEEKPPQIAQEHVTKEKTTVFKKAEPVVRKKVQPVSDEQKSKAPKAKPAHKPSTKAQKNEEVKSRNAMPGKFTNQAKKKRQDKEKKASNNGQPANENALPVSTPAPELCVDESQLQSISVRQAVEQFRLMLLAGEGPFISGRVTKKDGCLVVSSQCLDLVDSLCPMVNRTAFEVFCERAGFLVDGSKIRLRIDHEQ